MPGKLEQTKTITVGFWDYSVPVVLGLMDNGDIWMGHVEIPPTLLWQQITPPPVGMGNPVINLEVIEDGIGEFTKPVIVATTKQGDLYMGVSDIVLLLPGIVVWQLLASPP